MGIHIEELTNYPVRVFCIKPIEDTGNEEIGDIYYSLSYAVGKISGLFLDENIPHNILFT